MSFIPLLTVFAKNVDYVGVPSLSNSWIDQVKSAITEATAAARPPRRRFMSCPGLFKLTIWRDRAPMTMYPCLVLVITLSGDSLLSVGRNSTDPAPQNRLVPLRMSWYCVLGENGWVRCFDRMMYFHKKKLRRTIDLERKKYFTTADHLRRILIPQNPQLIRFTNFYRRCIF